jgi:hypothetical protein
MPGITSAEPQKPASHCNGQGIQHRSLARSVDPCDEIELRMKLKFTVSETLEIFYDETVNSHIEPPY